MPRYNIRLHLNWDLTSEINGGEREREGGVGRGGVGVGVGALF